MGVVGAFLPCSPYFFFFVCLHVFSILFFYRHADLDLSRMGKRGRECQGATEKGIIIPSWRSDRGGGKLRRASDHPPLWMSSCAIKRAHRAATEVPGAPTLSCSSARAGWQAERFDFGNVILRHLGENWTGPVYLMDPHPPARAWQGQILGRGQLRMSGCQDVRPRVPIKCGIEPLTG